MADLIKNEENIEMETTIKKEEKTMETTTKKEEVTEMETVTETEVKEVKEVKAEPVKEKAAKAKAKKPVAKKEEQKQTDAKVVINTDNVLRADDEGMIEIRSCEQDEKNEIYDMERSINRKEIRNGIVSGVKTMVFGGKTQLALLCRTKGLNVIIKADDFFDTKTFKDWDTFSETEKFNKLRARANRFFGAVISYMPLQTIKDERNCPIVIASRKLAMLKKRETYFFKNSKTDICVGMSIQANIVAVSKNYVFVECFGAETTIPASELSAKHYVENVEKEYKVGQGISVSVVRLTKNEETKEVNIQVSAKAYEVSKMNIQDIDRSIIGSRFLATVINIARTGDFYICYIDLLNVQGRVRTDNFIGSEMPQNGDKVSFEVTDVKPEKQCVYGKALKLNA